MPARAVAAADCPVPKGPLPSTYGRAFHTACLLAGSLAKLAERLNVPESLLRDWIEGRSRPPEDKFLAAVEIILHDTEKRSGLGG
jgi:hypothetical protein